MSGNHFTNADQVLEYLKQVNAFLKKGHFARGLSYFIFSIVDHVIM